MPDGDVVRSEMPRLFISPFRSLCQGLSVEEMEREFLRANRDSIKRFGDEPVTALLNAVPVLEVLLHSGFMATSDDREAATVAEECIRRSIQNPDAATVATRAFGVMRSQIESDEVPLTADLRCELLTTYAHCLYDHQCHCRIPHAAAEHPNADIEYVSRSADDLRTVLRERMRSFGQHLARHETTDGLKIPRRAVASSDEISAEDYL